MPEGRSDAALLAAHVDGEHAAFGELVSRHRDRLWAVALRTTGHYDDAADGLQDGIVAAYRRAGSYRGEAAVTTWLHRVVVNACLDRMRAAQVRSTEPLPDDLAEYGIRAGANAGESAGEGDPAAASIASERRRLVVGALAELPVAQRAAIVLVDLEGFSVSEAAQILDCKVGTVKSRCSRGRTSLAQRLRPVLGEPTEPTAGSGPSADEGRPRNPEQSRPVPSLPPRSPPPGG